MENGRLGAAIVVSGPMANFTMIIANRSFHAIDGMHRCDPLDEHLDRHDDRMLISHCGLSCTAFMYLSVQSFLVDTLAVQERDFCEPITDSRTPSAVMMSRMRYMILFIRGTHLMERIPKRRGGFHCWKGSRMYTAGYWQLF